MNKKAFLEAILFTTTDPLSVSDIAKMMNIKPHAVEALLQEFVQKYQTEDHGIALSNVSGYKFIVKEDYASRVSHLTPHADLSRGLLRVLSIVAYKQPIKQSDIVKVIGNRTYEYVKELVKRGLIKTEKKSRTVLLSTTPHFQEYFGTTKNLKDVIEETDHETDHESGTEVFDR